MPRAYHSPSSVALGRRCKRAWAYAYISGLRDPEIPWADIADAEARGLRAKRDAPVTLPDGRKITTRQRSTALGKAVHAVLESWYHGARPDWEGLPGRVAESGLHWLPSPSASIVRVESAIGSVPIEVHGEESRGMRVDDVLWVGFRDLTVLSCAESERARLLMSADFPWIYDYKSTASIAQYALDDTQLERDLQANLYALATCDEYSVPTVPARWLYFETRATRRSDARTVRVTRARALDIVEKASEDARALDQIERVEDAPQNTAACGDYGGCQYHVSAGGPCDARRSVGRLIALQRKGRSMALSEEAKAGFSKFKAGGQAPAPAAPADAPGTPIAIPPAEASAPAPTPAIRKPRTAKATPAAEGTKAAAVLALAAELAEANAALASAQAKHDDVLARIHEASAA